MTSSYFYDYNYPTLASKTNNYIQIISNYSIKSERVDKPTKTND